MSPRTKNRQAINGNAVLSVPLPFFATRERGTGPTFLPLRRVGLNRSNANTAEMISDVGDNIPPGNDC